MQLDMSSLQGSRCDFPGPIPMPSTLVTACRPENGVGTADIRMSNPRSRGVRKASRPRPTLRAALCRTATCSRLRARTRTLHDTVWQPSQSSARQACGVGFTQLPQWLYNWRYNCNTIVLPFIVARLCAVMCSALAARCCPT